MARTFFPAPRVAPTPAGYPPTSKNQPATPASAPGRESTPAPDPRTQGPPTAVKARGRRHPSSGQEAQASPTGQPPACGKGPPESKHNFLQPHGHHMPDTLNDLDPSQSGVRQLADQTSMLERTEDGAEGQNTASGVMRRNRSFPENLKAPESRSGRWGAVTSKSAHDPRYGTADITDDAPQEHRYQPTTGLQRAGTFVSSVANAGATTTFPASPTASGPLSPAPLHGRDRTGCFDQSRHRDRGGLHHSPGDHLQRRAQQVERRRRPAHRTDPGHGPLRSGPAPPAGVHPQAPPL